MSEALDCGGKAAALPRGGAALQSGGCATAVQMPAALTAAAVALAFLPGEWLELRRDGDLYRIITCHFTHWTHEQLAWDALAFLALGVACTRHNAAAARATLLASVVLIPIAVLAFAPEIGAYRGLSGLASAMFALLVTSVIAGAPNKGVGAAWLFAILFAAKLAFETLTGGAVFANDMGDGVVSVPVAHLAGALIGVIGGLRREKLLLLAPLVLASCISARPQLPAQSVNVAMCKSADLTGEWYDRRSTPLGPSWVKLVLRRDCSFTLRAQLVFVRLVDKGFYRTEFGKLNLGNRSLAFVRNGDELRLEETPGQWHTFKLSRCGSSWPCF